MEGRTSRPAVIDKIVEGKLNSFYEQLCCSTSRRSAIPRSRSGSSSQAAIAKMGENIAIPRFARFKVGEAA